MSRLSEAIDLQRQELEGLVVRKPIDEIDVWKLLAESTSQRTTFEMLRCALDLGKLNESIADWPKAYREELGTPTTRTIGTRRNPWWTHPVTGCQMIVVPAGVAQLGARTEAVDVEGFSIARFPVTNADFAKFLNATGYEPADSMNYGEYLENWKSDGMPDARQAEHPVTSVNTMDAWAYCRWAMGCLPTTLQWEKAARGNDGRKFPWGDRPRYDFARGAAGLAQIASTATCKVGKYPQTRSPYGVEDLVGNVSQWCEPNERPTYPLERAEQHPVCGACFYRETAKNSFASHQRWLNSMRRNRWVGFRLCV